MATRICHVTSLHDDNDSRIFQRECKSLVKKYEVYLVAPNAETRTVDGVHIVGVPLPNINQRVRRWLKLKTILRPLYEIDADVYHFHDPELISLGLKLKKRGKKIVFDSHEDVPMQILSKTIIPKPLRKIASNVYARYEARILKQYTALVSVTVHIVDRLKRINENTYQITNYPLFSERETVTHTWDREVCFAGLLTDYWSLNQIIEALPAANAHMHLAGLYASEEYLNQLKRLDGWSNVTFHGTLPHVKVLDLYNKCSIGLAIESYDNPNAGYRTGSLGCTKIPDYMASGLPVIVSDSVVWGSIVREYGCGVVVKNPKDIEEIKKAIIYILNNPHEAQIMGENAKKASKEEFNWNTQEFILFEMYELLTR